jgi:hypothetical protein
MRLATRLLSTWAVVAVCQLPARASDACTISDCRPPVRLLSDFYPALHAGLPIPGNLVYFRVEVADPGPMILRTRAGGVIAASVRQIGKDRVFAPDAPLAPDLDVELEYTPHCESGAPPPDPRGVFAFRTTAAGELRARPGAVELIEYGITDASHEQLRGTVHRFRYQPPDELLSTKHLMDHTLTVDGHAFALRAALPEPVLNIVSRCWSGWYANQAPAADDCGALDSIPPGRHRLEVRTSIVGHDDPAPVRFDLRTGDAEWCALSSGAEPAATATESDASGGCALGGRSPGSSYAGMALATLVFAASRGRRRGRTSTRR